jgi:hypothetical protein
MHADYQVKRTRESGMALIIAIGFLAILSIIGAVVLDLATRDISSSGVMTPVRKAFYTADRSVEYSMNREILTNISPSGAAVNLMTATTSGGILHKNIINSVNVIDGQLISGTVTDLGPKSLPGSIASYFGSEFGANVYHVAAEAKAGPASAEQKVNVDASIVRLFKLDDDTIYRTSGGG